MEYLFIFKLIFNVYKFQSLLIANIHSEIKLADFRDKQNIQNNRTVDTKQTVHYIVFIHSVGHFGLFNCVSYTAPALVCWLSDAIS